MHANGHGEQGSKLELQELIESFRWAILTTRGPDGHFHSRPMAFKLGSRTGELWFATARDTEKVHDLESEARCAVTFFDRGSTYVSLSGWGRLVRDADMRRWVWDPSWKPWFPQGPESRDLLLVHFLTEHAEYVHPATGRVKVLFTMVRNLVRGSRVEPAPKKELDLPAPHAH